ncbi:hypothetical protein HKX48_008824 [Thoreauomyces humboldtii]|nr:hypothetical protein HKX48_008824 [Thoreauomyces humboldtii]
MRAGSVELRASTVAARHDFPLLLPRLESYCHKSHDTHPCTDFARTAPPPAATRALRIDVRRLCALTDAMWNQQTGHERPLVNGGLDGEADGSSSDADSEDEYLHESFMESIRACVAQKPTERRWKRLAKPAAPAGHARRGAMPIAVRKPERSITAVPATGNHGPSTTQTLSSSSSYQPSSAATPATSSSTPVRRRMRRTRRMSVATLPPTVEEIVHILGRPQASRTSAEDQRLFAGLRSLVAFKNLSDFVMAQLLGVIHLNDIEANRTVFKQGDVATSWYVILQGRVDVLVNVGPEEMTRGRSVVAASTTGYSSSKPLDLFARTSSVLAAGTGGIAAGAGALAAASALALTQPEQEVETRVVVQLSDGEGFGDLALSNNARRNATIKTVTACVLLRIEKEEYLRVVKFIHEKERQEKILFLKRCPALAQGQGLTLIADAMIMKTHLSGSFVLRAGHIQTEVCFIKSGTCAVYAYVEMTRPFHHDDRTLVTTAPGSMTLPQGQGQGQSGTTRKPRSARFFTEEDEENATIFEEAEHRPSRGGDRSGGRSGTDDGRCYQFFLGYLRPGDYFGEQIVHYDVVDAKDAPVVSAMTVKCLGTVEIGHIQLHDARARLQEDMLPMGKLTGIAADRNAILTRYAALVDGKKWNRHKKATMDKLVREMTRDPNTDLNKFAEGRVKITG